MKYTILILGIFSGIETIGRHKKLQNESRIFHVFSIDYRQKNKFKGSKEQEREFLVFDCNIIIIKDNIKLLKSMSSYSWQSIITIQQENQIEQQLKTLNIEEKQNNQTPKATKHISKKLQHNKARILYQQKPKKFQEQICEEQIVEQTIKKKKKVTFQNVNDEPQKPLFKTVIIVKEFQNQFLEVEEINYDQQQ
ncbi:unnamed protein product [Paramecium primaurelia]|uniref:Uncharacterized protein n=1 Tax=Paramecium primaurelia TaxID=5886 RepID=A0A8S1PQC7_PARPR|nr:unnamed protein product [Paramecium primaurelia]